MSEEKAKISTGFTKVTLTDPKGNRVSFPRSMITLVDSEVELANGQHCKVPFGRIQQMLDIGGLEVLALSSRFPMGSMDIPSGAIPRLCSTKEKQR